MHFVTVYPRAMGVHLYKSVGRIPFHMARDYGFESTFAYCELESEIDDPAYEQHVRLRSLGTFHDRASAAARIAAYVAAEAPRIDVLNLYHLTWEALAIASIYRARNPRGICFLKLDWDHRVLHRIHGRPRPAKLRVMHRLMRGAPIDFYTIETRAMQREIQGFFDEIDAELLLVPCGITLPTDIDIDEIMPRKENVVLTAGRIGLYQKNTESFLRVIERLPEELRDRWTFVLAGGLHDGFEAGLAEFRRRRPDLDDRVIHTGFIADRDELDRLYDRSAVFCLTSRFESFATVLAESMLRGCYVVTTDVGAARDLTDDGRLGTIVPIEDDDALYHGLCSVLSGEVEVARLGALGHHRVTEHFRWASACRVLDRRIRGTR